MNKKVNAVKVENGSVIEIEDEVAVEKKLKIYLNDKFIANLTISPGYEKELGMGFCVGEGFIDAGSIKDARADENSVKVYTGDKNFEFKFELYLSSDCMAGFRPKKITKGDEPYDVTVSDVSVPPGLTVESKKIFDGMRKLQKKAVMWKKTGGFHIAGLMHGDDFNDIIAVEDISRHTAADKVIGIGITKGLDFGKCVLLTSGRIPGDIVVKLARVGIPVAVTRTSVIDSGIKVAENTGVTLIGFARGNRMNVYTHKERIII